MQTTPLGFSDTGTKTSASTLPQSADIVKTSFSEFAALGLRKLTIPLTGKKPHPLSPNEGHWGLTPGRDEGPMAKVTELNASSYT